MSLRFVDLFAGLGGFHTALQGLGHDCVFACELNPELQEVYRKNFAPLKTVYGDIRTCKGQIPPRRGRLETSQVVLLVRGTV